MNKAETYSKLQKILQDRGAGFILLIDPDKLAIRDIPRIMDNALNAGVDVFFVGGSFLMRDNFNDFVQAMKENAAGHPVIIFPGSVYQISPQADAILFLSLISSRNPEHLIGAQAKAAPIIWRMGLETISCGYMLIESGKLTSAQFVSGSLPIPREKVEIALAHGLAAQYLGMQTVYLEAGSGASLTIPEEMIAALREALQIPILVGGGIRTPEEAARKVAAGADFIVVGNFFEKEKNYHLMGEFARAIHTRG